MEINYTNGAFETLGINRIKKNSYVISVGNYAINDFHLTGKSLKKIALEILEELNKDDLKIITKEN